MKCANYWDTTTVVPNSNWAAAIPDDVEYLIVGAGGAGLATAYSLALNGATGIVVVDPAIQTYRSARRQSGAVSILPYLPTHLRNKGLDDEQIKGLVNIGLWNAALTERFMLKFGNGSNWCDKESIGSFRVAFQRSQLEDLKESFKFFQELPTKPFLFNEKSFKHLSGVRNGYGGLYIPNDFVVNPAKYLNGLSKACQSLGVNIINGFEVNNILVDEDKCLVALDHVNNTIKAKKLILCLGSSMAKVMSLEVLNDLFSRRRIQYTATKQLDEQIPPYLLLDADGKTIIRTHNKRVIYAYDADDKELADLKVNSTTINVMNGRMTYRLHCAHDSELKSEYVWTRDVVMTPDHLPFITQFESLPNIYLNMGYNEHSLSYQMIGGHIMAGLLLKNKYPVPGSEIFSLERLEQSA